MFKIKKITPLFNHVLVTKDLYETERIGNTNLIDVTKTDTIKEYQKVVDVGPLVKNIKPGDIVFIDPRRYMHVDHRFNKVDENNMQQDNMHAFFDIPTFNVYDREDGSCRELMYIADNDCMFVASGEEFNENPSIVSDSDIVAN